MRGRSGPRYGLCRGWGQTSPPVVRLQRHGETRPPCLAVVLADRREQRLARHHVDVDPGLPAVSVFVAERGLGASFLRDATLLGRQTLDRRQVLAGGLRHDGYFQAEGLPVRTRQSLAALCCRAGQLLREAATTNDADPRPPVTRARERGRDPSHRGLHRRSGSTTEGWSADGHDDADPVRSPDGSLRCRPRDRRRTARRDAA